MIAWYINNLNPGPIKGLIYVKPVFRVPCINVRIILIFCCPVIYLQDKLIDEFFSAPGQPKPIQHRGILLF